MFRLCFSLIVFLQVFVSSEGCPTRCLCFRTTVRCMFLQLESIPKVPPETTILDLRFNKIKEIPPGIFKGMKDLSTLLLNNNDIARIENGAFDGLSQLRYLYLYKNQIKTIGAKSLSGLHKLEQLYIHFNNLEELDPETFSSLPALERLFLHNNNIRRLPKEIFSSLTLLRRLRLDSNALICDCQMMWLSEMLKEMKGDTQAAATCEYPTNMQGKSLLNLDLKELDCSKPILTIEPSNVEAASGGTAYFTCKAEGDPQPEIIWLHNRQEIVTNTVDETSRYKLLEDGTLMIENARDTDQGVYECVAKNSAGETKSLSAELKYQGEPVVPKIIEPPHDTGVLEGESITLKCLATGHPTPSITWTKNDGPIPVHPRYAVLHTGSLLITNAQTTDTGSYMCVAFNSEGEESRIARVVVQVQLTFAERPRDQNVIEGSTVTFTCLVEGQPAPTIRWTRENRPLPTDERFVVTRDKTSLQIRNVQYQDRGYYECVAENPSGRKSATAQLLVRSNRPRVPPSFVTTPRELTVPMLTSIKLACSATGDPRPDIQWYRDERDIFYNERIFQDDEGDLNIYNVTKTDEGLYECRAQNSEGAARALARIFVSEERRNFVGDPFVNGSIQEAIRNVNNAINSTLREINDRSRIRTPHELLTLFKFPNRQALEITRSAEVYERTLELIHRELQKGNQYNITDYETVPYNEIISPAHLAVIANLSGCTTHRRKVNCREDMCYHQKYRTFDGTCNNLQHPMWGASLTQLKRFVKPAYENGFNSPIGWNSSKLYNGFRKPSARTISTKIASAHEITPDESYTHMLMQWGQFIDHDLDFTPMAVSNARFSDGRYCNETCDNQAPCFPIPVPEDDPRIHRHRCMGTTRSSAMCGSGMTSVLFSSVSPREQLNQITSFMDGSNIYGSSEEEAYDLRDFSSERGLLREGHQYPGGKALLPFNIDAPVDCQIDPNTDHIPCFLAGDHRANEQLGLLSMHTLWMREHNRVATELLENNPHWDGDMLFHEARKIVGAELQHITYTEWLPKILGPTGMDMIGEYKGYDPNVDASIMNSFATAAFRFGHSLINPFIYRLNETFQPIRDGNLPLHKAFFAPFRILEEGGIDPIMRGLFGVAAKKLVPGQFLNTELTEKLFKLAHEVALDLAALNVQRGRDHGLPSYNEFRRKCGLSVAETFDDLAEEITDREMRERLEDVYGHPGSIDLWVGGLSEDLVPGSRLGPTFMCIIAEQFKRIRDGDRFWHEKPDVFSPEQLGEIKKVTLSKVICDNSDRIRRVQKDVFRTAENPNGYLQCDNEQFHSINLELWTHCCHDCSKSGEFNSVISHGLRRRKRDTNDIRYSFPEDKPQSDERDFDNRVPSYTSETRQTDNSVIKNDMVDLIDSRIEGVEGIMANLKKTVSKLNKKVRKLERKLVIAHKSPSSCIDGQGQEKQNGEKWKEHDCKICDCLDGQVDCMTETCQLPKCMYPKKIPGQCCPVC